MSVEKKYDWQDACRSAGCRAPSSTARRAASLPESRYPLFTLAEEILDGLAVLGETIHAVGTSPVSLRSVLDAARSAELDLQETRKRTAARENAERVPVSVSDACDRCDAAEAALRIQMERLIAGLGQELPRGDLRWGVLGLDDAGEWTSVAMPDRDSTGSPETIYGFRC